MKKNCRPLTGQRIGEGTDFFAGAVPRGVGRRASCFGGSGATPMFEDRIQDQDFFARLDSGCRFHIALFQAAEIRVK
jgi:hypothetical protein